MSTRTISQSAWVAILLSGLFSAADALCSLFVSVYLWVNSHDLAVLCRFYIALFVLTPIVFAFAGWYARTRDRLDVYRLGLVLHIVYYGTLLALREQSPHFATHLGILLGIAWGIYFAGANTIYYDVTTHSHRELFIGVLNAVSGFFRLVAPLVGGLIITRSSNPLVGYHRLFGVVIFLYLISVVISRWIPREVERQPFRLWRALLPGPDQRDWRLSLLASASIAGSFEIMGILLALLMYLATTNEMAVGGFSAYQALITIAVSTIFGWHMRPKNRRGYLAISSVVLAASGLLLLVSVTPTTLIAFAFLRSGAMAVFGIGHYSLRLEIIARSVQEPSQRIEYLCAWEVPLALGRLVIMFTLLACSSWLTQNDIVIRVAIVLICALNLLTYYFLSRTSVLREELQ